jgi:hypothetical protein
LAPNTDVASGFPLVQFRSSSTLISLEAHICMNVSGIRHKASSSPTSFLLYPSNMMNAPVTTPTDDEKTITPPHNAVEVYGPGVSEDALIEQYGAERVRRLLLKVRGALKSCR